MLMYKAICDVNFNGKIIPKGTKYYSSAIIPLLYVTKDGKPVFHDDKTLNNIKFFERIDISTENRDKEKDLSKLADLFYHNLSSHIINNKIFVGFKLHRDTNIELIIDVLKIILSENDFKAYAEIKGKIATNNILDEAYNSTFDDLNFDEYEEYAKYLLHELPVYLTNMWIAHKQNSKY